jgi:hypothetical protein
MKKYTIVYGHYFQTGTHTSSVTRFDRVETDNLIELLKSDKYNCAVWFVFDGWCNLTNDNL